MEDLSHLLRDYHSGELIGVDVGVLDFLAAVMDSVGVATATVLSAYRTVATNRALASTTFGVADNSQHLYGRALDIRLETHLTDAMQKARKMQRGGVGWYPHSGFFHLDTGPVRNWDMKERGLGSLLLDDRHRPVDRIAEDRSYTPEVRHSGLLRPEMNNIGRIRPEMTASGRLRPEMVRGKRIARY